MNILEIIEQKKSKRLDTLQKIIENTKNIRYTIEDN